MICDRSTKFLDLKLLDLDRDDESDVCQYELKKKFKDICELNDSRKLQRFLTYNLEMINLPVVAGIRAVHLLARRGFSECLEILIQNNAKVNVVDKDSSFTPFHFAVYYNHYKCVEVLLSCLGIQPNVLTITGQSVLHLAASQSSGEVLALLLQTKLGLSASHSFTALLDCQDRAGQTALHVAVAAGMTKAVELLLQAGARTDARDCGGCTARSLCLALGRPALLPIFDSARPPGSPVSLAAPILTLAGVVGRGGSPDSPVGSDTSAGPESPEKEETASNQSIIDRWVIVAPTNSVATDASGAYLAFTRREDAEELIRVHGAELSRPPHALPPPAPATTSPGITRAAPVNAGDSKMAWRRWLGRSNLVQRVFAVKDDGSPGGDYLAFDQCGPPGSDRRPQQSAARYLDITALAAPSASAPSSSSSVAALRVGRFTDDRWRQFATNEWFVFWSPAGAPRISPPPSPRIDPGSYTPGTVAFAASSSGSSINSSSINSSSSGSEWNVGPGRRTGSLGDVEARKLQLERQAESHRARSETILGGAPSPATSSPASSPGEGEAPSRVPRMRRASFGETGLVTWGRFHIDSSGEGPVSPRRMSVS